MLTPVNKAWQLSGVDIAGQLQSDPIKGLSEHEAAKRIALYGPNEFESVEEESLLDMFFRQFASALVAVLAAAAVLAFSFQEWLEGIAILVVIVVNAFIGFFMEWQSIRSMESLRRMSETTAKVIRNSQLLMIKSADLVPGDLVYMEAGDNIPADCRLVEEVNIGVKEAALTGESAQVHKFTEIIPGDISLADRENMLYKGTIVTRGNGRAIVTATGKHTELGKIYDLVSKAESEATPLEKKLNVLSRKLIWLTLLLTTLILAIGILQGRDVYLMVKTAIALGIAAIPEGLPVVATIALARGMLRLAKHQVIVKKLSAVETLAETSVIFTDKTGTLTENKLSVDTLVFQFAQSTVNFRKGKLILENGSKPTLTNTFAYEQMIKVCLLCNNAALSADGQTAHTVGDPLEIALLQFAKGSGADIASQRSQFPRLSELPFSSEAKMMGTLHHNGRRPDYLVCIKGALEVVLKECDYVLTKEGKVPLTNRESWLQHADELAAKGLRILALAYSEINHPEDEFFHNLIFIGYVGFLDPPRAEVSEAIKKCRDAGIKVVMVTGDHPETAKNIAQKIGLAPHGKEAVVYANNLASGKEFSLETLEKIRESDVFARVDPSQKLDLVTAYQEGGYIVGMTGDGINDTPALKKADIGIAMGERGTQAAIETADLVLEDDSFNSIVLAIEQGRGILQNIRYFVVYLLSCNLSEILVVSVAAIGNFGIPLLPLQILFLNMVTDVFPALALGMNREASDIMEQPPHPSGEPVINRQLWNSIGIYALSMTLPVVGVLLFSTYYLKTSPEIANNLTFYTLILAQLFHVFNLTKTSESFVNNEITKNIHIWMALLTCLLLTILVYFIPVTAEVLQLKSISWSTLWIVLPFSLFPVLLIQILKRTGLIN